MVAGTYCGTPSSVRMNSLIGVDDEQRESCAVSGTRVARARSQWLAFWNGACQHPWSCSFTCADLARSYWRSIVAHGLAPRQAGFGRWDCYPDRNAIQLRVCSLKSYILRCRPVARQL